MKLETDMAWAGEVVNCAQSLSKKIEEQFMHWINASLPFVPKPQTKEQEVDFNRIHGSIFIEYLFGTAVALAVHGAGTSEQFEEDIVQLVREKFDCIRKIKNQEVKTDASNH